MEPRKNDWKAFFFYFLTFGLFFLGLYEEYLIYSGDRYGKVGLKKERGFDQFGGPFKYLTIQNMTFDFLFFTLAMLNALMDCLSKKASAEPSGLKKLVDWTYSRIAFPMGMFVSITFWGIYFVDRELIFPKKLDMVFASWHNHIMHTLPLVALLIDNMLTYHKYSRSFVKGASTTIFIAAAYCVWTLYVNFAGGFWIYPILAVLTPLNRALFFAGLFLFVAFLYKVGERLNALLWSLKPKQQKTKAK